MLILPLRFLRHYLCYLASILGSCSPALCPMSYDLLKWTKSINGDTFVTIRKPTLKNPISHQLVHVNRRSSVKRCNQIENNCGNMYFSTKKSVVFETSPVCLHWTQRSTQDTCLFWIGGWVGVSVRFLSPIEEIVPHFLFCRVTTWTGMEGKPPKWRISLQLPLLSHAELLFLVEIPEMKTSSWISSFPQLHGPLQIQNISIPLQCKDTYFCQSPVWRANLHPIPTHYEKIGWTIRRFSSIFHSKSEPGIEMYEKAFFFLTMCSLSFTSRTKVHIDVMMWLCCDNFRCVYYFVEFFNKRTSNRKQRIVT